MFWVPYAGTIPLSLVWPSQLAATSLSLAALVAAARLALLVLRAARNDSAVTTHGLMPIDDHDQEVKRVAA